MPWWKVPLPCSHEEEYGDDFATNDPDDLDWRILTELQAAFGGGTGQPPREGLQDAAPAAELAAAQTAPAPSGREACGHPARRPGGTRLRSQYSTAIRPWPAISSPA